jgi:DNA-binding PadR family transcriptional regulator
MAPSQGPGSADPFVGGLRRSGLVSLLVLHYVADGPCYGNQLMDRIGELTAGALRINPNTMYPLLRSMETRGLLDGVWEDPDRRSRRFYRITAAGESERKRLAGELAPNLEAIVSTIELIRHELLENRA